MSPHLFNLFLEWIVARALRDYQGGVEIGGIKITNLRYADDIVFLSESREDLQWMMDRLEEQCARYQMVINVDKTKSMKIGRQEEQLHISLRGGVIEQVDEFKYLGVYFSSKGGTERSIRERIAMGHRAFGRLKNVWKDRNISTTLKIRLLRAIVVPAALYGAECWVLRKGDERRLLAFEMKCVRRICRVRWEDRLTNERVREMAGLEDTIVDIVRDGQRRWFGHVTRMNQDRWPNVTLNGRVHGSRPRGRPRFSWMKMFVKANCGVPVRQLVHLASDRGDWRRWRHWTWDPTWRPPDGI